VSEITPDRVRQNRWPVTDNDLVRRIWVVGTSGSGKSTLAAVICERLGVPWIQLDALFHQPDWTPLPKPEFRAVVARMIAGDAWVVDGNYTGTLDDLVLDRADTVVSLEFPRRTVMRQIVWRTARRVVTREELWNGNRERLRNIFSLDRERSIILWAWTSHGEAQRRVVAARAEPKYRGIQFVQLGSRRQVDEFVANLATSTSDQD
jgi:adenylate kinase family enzyme